MSCADRNACGFVCAWFPMCVVVTRCVSNPRIILAHKISPPKSTLVNHKEGSQKKDKVSEFFSALYLKLPFL